MQAWILLWKIVFVLGIGIFTVMALWVSIAGLRDIKSLFASLDRQHHKTETEIK